MNTRSVSTRQGHRSSLVPRRHPQHDPQRMHSASTADTSTRTQGCSPYIPQATAGTIEHMNAEHAYAEPYEPGFNVTVYRLPASFEDMEYLGLDPETGEPIGGDD